MPERVTSAPVDTFASGDHKRLGGCKSDDTQNSGRRCQSTDQIRLLRPV